MEGTVPVTLTIKQVPDALAEKLRAQATQNHRSLQGELMSILEAVLSQPDAGKSDSYTTSGMKRPSNEMTKSSSCDLLAELDAIVAGSRWGNATILSREQADARSMADSKLLASKK